MQAGTCTFSSGHLPRLRVDALPPHVFALLTKLATDRSRDDDIRPHAETCWHDRDERLRSAEAIAQQLLGFRFLGVHLDGCIAPTWNGASGWLEVPARIHWAYRWEPGQTFYTQAHRESSLTSRSTRDKRFQVTLTRAQVRHVKPAVVGAAETSLRSWARTRLESSGGSDEEVQALDRWISEKDPEPHGRKSLFTPQWWEYAEWVYRHYGKREPIIEIAKRNESVEGAASNDATSRSEPSYVSRKQLAFVKAGRLTPVSEQGRARRTTRTT